MPTAISETSLAVTLPEPPPITYDVLLQGERRHAERRAVARRPGREQGMALEVIGHAVEYLIDSRMFLTEAPYTKAEQEAVQMLMSASRLVFADCDPHRSPPRPRLRVAATNLPRTNRRQTS